MRLIGQAERSLDYMCRRAVSRVASAARWPTRPSRRSASPTRARPSIKARLLVLHAAWKMDVAGNKAAKKEIAMIKVAAPAMACQVIDWAMQVHGAAGVSDDFPLAFFYAQARTLRFADGPDEVHRNQIAKLELVRLPSAEVAARGGGPGRWPGQRPAQRLAPGPAPAPDARSSDRCTPGSPAARAPA